MSRSHPRTNRPWGGLPTRGRLSIGPRCLLLFCLAASLLAAAEYHGQVGFNGLPVPGATVTLTHDDKTFTTTTDASGVYSFADLSEGHYSIEIDMLGFAPIKQEIVVAPNTPAAVWELKLLPLGQIKAAIAATPSPASPVQQPRAPEAEAKPAAPAAPRPAQDELTERAADGFLINGSVNNAAASPFSQAQAFGNHRMGGRGLYNGGIGFTFDNSALDARPYSLTGQDTPKPSYNRMTGLLAFGGPLRIPHLLRNGPNIFVGYQWTRNRTANTQPALVPDATERSGDFSQTTHGEILDPATGSPFPGNRIPLTRISPQAQALLRFYPLPNFIANGGYNYQVPLVTSTHQDALQSRFNKSAGMRNQFFGYFGLQSIRLDNPSLFGFLDSTDTLGINTSLYWFHRFDHRAFLTVGYQFSRFSTHTTPYFENRENVSGLAGISGNSQDPLNWGPPSLTFSSGIAGLTDANSAFNRNQTSAVSPSLLWNRGRHNLQFGGDFRRQEFNYLSQQNPRGAFTFTGGASGNDFADFLLGVPDTSAIAFGNADKYFRQSVYDAYFTDDWRVSPEFTLNAGVRWEYGAPITELYNRLVNLDIAPGFSAVSAIVANDPVGSLTGRHYPNSLIQPDKTGFEPRIGLAWRPVSGASWLVRAGYGIYYDTSVYQNIATQMAQQAPLSKSLSVQNSAANPLTLANGFNASPNITQNTFAIDPNFRVGYAQEWQFTLQSDLPGSLQMTATYLGIKGSRGVQEFLPNTYPTGERNPCAVCPTGFEYVVSNGNSTRQSLQVQLRRRLHNGLTGLLQYTFSKSIDDDAVLGGLGASATQQGGAAQGGGGSGTGGSGGGGASPGAGSTVSAPPISTASQNLLIAQNWLNLGAERSLSTFDQRHLLTLQLQYTTGMGLGGGTLLSGWKGALFKEWTVATQITAGSGLPESPIYLVPVAGTGVTTSYRPDYTGLPLYTAPAGLHLNPAAYTAPLPGQWGNAGRNSITGPAQFTLNASLGRTFRLSDRFNLDLRFDSTNALNHVSYTQWNTTINSPQFGLAANANAMRSMQTTLRVRF
jgi:Carboxypeptidase regulatory-like domain